MSFVFSFSEVERAVPQEIYIVITEEKQHPFREPFPLITLAEGHGEKAFFLFWMLRHSRVMVLKGTGQGKSHA